MSKDTAKVPVYKKWWFWVIIVVVVIAIGGGAASSNKDAKKVEGGETASTSKTEDNVSEQKFKVGDTIAVEDQEMTILSVERNWQSGNQFIKPGDGKEYIKVNIKLENKSGEKLSYYSSYWTIEDSDGAIENSAVVVGNDDALSYGELAAGGKKSGSLVFEVPSGDAGLKVHYQPSFWSNREAVVEL